MPDIYKCKLSAIVKTKKVKQNESMLKLCKLGSFEEYYASH